MKAGIKIECKWVKIAVAVAAFFEGIVCIPLFLDGRLLAAIAAIFLSIVVLTLVAYLFYFNNDEKAIVKTSAGEREESSSTEEEEDDDEYSYGRMRSLYKRIINYMERERPYLSDSFTEEELARTMASNINYISQCINRVSDKNFKRLVNGYRIRYAMDLIEKDPKMKMMEVAMLSGFRSNSTFNVRFKMEAKKTPSQYVQEVQSRNLGHHARSEGQERSHQSQACSRDG